MKPTSFLLAILGLVAVWAGWAAEEATMPEKVVLQADFDHLPDGELPDGWWAEGGEWAGIRDHALFIKADPPKKGAPGNVCTVWNHTPLPANVRVEFDATVKASSFDANNINFFLLYTMPDGRSLYDTREERADGSYKKYHDLDGYIFTFLNDWTGEGGRYEDGSTKARFRMRRCPGFKLLTETYASHCKQDVTYHVTITKLGGQITFAVDGTVYLEQTDPEPWKSGLLGLRTYHTDLAWDNLKVVALED